MTFRIEIFTHDKTIHVTFILKTLCFETVNYINFSKFLQWANHIYIFFWQVSGIYIDCLFCRHKSTNPGHSATTHLGHMIFFVTDKSDIIFSVNSKLMKVSYVLAANEILYFFFELKSQKPMKVVLAMKKFRVHTYKYYTLINGLIAFRVEILIPSQKKISQRFFFSN